MNAQQDEIDLREYLRSGSREALGSIARRHLNFVYGVARREMGDEHQAEDVTQAVFIVLSRCAAKVKPVSLPGWLFVTTRNVAANARKAALRRQFHERKAAEVKSEHVMNSTHEQDQIAHIGHHLHEALAAVRESDRSIVIMRHVHGLEITEISGALGLSDDATRKRLERAMEKLRRFLTGRGFAIGSTAIATAVASVARAAPNELAGAVRTATTSSAAAMLAKATTTSMAFAQVKVAAMILIALGIAGGLTTAVWRALNRSVAVAQTVTMLLAAEEPPAPMIAHSGVVVDPDGKPLSGVRVWMPGLDPAHPKEIKAETTTDAEGHYSFKTLASTGRETVLFDHPSFALAWRNYINTDPPPIDQTIQLAPGADLKIQVVDAAGRISVSAADVHLNLRDNYPLGVTGSSKYAYLDLPLPGETVHTDADGIAIFKRLPMRARANASVIHLNYARFPDGGANYGDDDFVARPSPMPFVASLKPGGQIRIRPAKPDHAFPQRIEVFAIPKSSLPLPMLSSTGAIDPDGSYFFAGLDPGKYDLVINPPTDAAPSNYVWLKAENIEVAAGRTTDASVAFGAGQTITGRLVDAKTKSPAAGYRVWIGSSLRGERLVSLSTHSDQNGHFEFRVRPDQYSMEVELIASSIQKISVGSAPLALGDVEISTYPVFRGRLLDANGKPVSNGYVMAGTGRYETGPDGSFAIDSRTSRATVINGVGSAHVIVGTPLFAFNTEHVLGAAAVVDEKMADPALRNAPSSQLPAISLRALTTVSGEVVDDAGKPFSSAVFSIIVIGGPQSTSYRSDDLLDMDRLAWGRIERDGNKFKFDVPYNLSLDVMASKAGLQAHASADHLQPGESRDVGQLVLQGLTMMRNRATGAVSTRPQRPVVRVEDLTGALVGQVVDDASGAPVGGAQVQVQAPDDQPYFDISTDTTGQDGAFSLLKLPRDAKLPVTIWRSGYMVQSSQATFDGKPVTFRLRHAASDLIGKPAPELTVNTWVSAATSLGELKGKVVLLDMGIENWNLSTRRTVLMAAEKYSSRGLAVIELARWTSSQSAGRGLNMPASVPPSLIDRIKGAQLPFPIAIDAPGRIPVDQMRANIGALGQTAFAYGVDRAPALILIDKQGIVRAAPNRDHLDEWIEKLLAE